MVRAPFVFVRGGRGGHPPFPARIVPHRGKTASANPKVIQPSPEIPLQAIFLKSPPGPGQESQTWFLRTTVQHPVGFTAADLLVLELLLCRQ